MRERKGIGFGQSPKRKRAGCLGWTDGAVISAVHAEQIDFMELLVQSILAGVGITLIGVPLFRWVRRSRRSREASRQGTLPPGWTDDLRIELPSGCTVDDLVGVVISNALQQVTDDETERQLVARFGLSAEDAAFARDRTFGGIVRAAMSLQGNPHNDPDRMNDPIAAASFKRVKADPSIALRIYPEFNGPPPAR